MNVSAGSKDVPKRKPAASKLPPKKKTRRGKKDDDEDEDDEAADPEHTPVGEDDEDGDDNEDGMFGLDVSGLLDMDEKPANKRGASKKPASRQGGTMKKPGARKREEAP